MNQPSPYRVEFVAETPGLGFVVTTPGYRAHAQRQWHRVDSIQYGPGQIAGLASASPTLVVGRMVAEMLAPHIGVEGLLLVSRDGEPLDRIPVLLTRVDLETGWVEFRSLGEFTVRSAKWDTAREASLAKP